MGFYMEVPPRLLSLLPCCVYLKLHSGPRAPTLCSARAFRVRYQFGPSPVESITLAMSVALSLMQVSSRIGFSASTIAFATWHRRFGSVINRLRSTSFGVSLVLSLFLRFGADLRGMQISDTRDCDPILVPLVYTVVHLLSICGLSLVFSFSRDFQED